MSSMNERIKQRRRELGMTQKELAEMLSISDKTVSRWESGNQMPDALLLPDLTDALKITLNDLYGINPQENTDSNERIFEPSQPSVKSGIIIGYKTAMIIGIVITVLGAVYLIHADIINGTDEGRMFGQLVLFGGCAILFISELVYIILYRAKSAYNYSYLVGDITYSGLAAIIITFLFMLLLPFYLAFSFSVWYAISVMSVVIMFAIMMFAQKRALRKEGVYIGKSVSKVSVILIAVSLIGFAAVCVLMAVYTNNAKGQSSVALQIYYIENLNMWEHKAQFYTYLLTGIPITAAILINYIELMIKADGKPRTSVQTGSR